MYLYFKLFDGLFDMESNITQYYDDVMYDEGARQFLNQTTPQAMFHAQKSKGSGGLIST